MFKLFLVAIPLQLISDAASTALLGAEAFTSCANAQPVLLAAGAYHSFFYSS